MSITESLSRIAAPILSDAIDIAQFVAAMPIEHRVGQLLMVGFQGTALNADLATFITEAGIGGVVLFADNIKSPWQGQELTSALRECAAAAELLPLFIAIDQEGGTVSRLRYPFTTVPSPMAIAATGDVANAARIASVLAAELRELGINLNLSAVVDVNTCPYNPVIGPRAYSDDPRQVAAFASAAIAAHHRHGVLVAAKHFPGHGDTSLDSHHALPVIGHDLDRMQKIELAPFVAAIAAGADAIVTAHVTYPGIDHSGHPATLSRPILEDLLRGQLGYQGIVITDAIEMNAIARHYGQVEGALLSVVAGADIVLTVGRLDEQRSVFQALLGAVREGRIPEQRVNAAAARIVRAKVSIANRLFEGTTPDGSWPRDAHQMIARQVARESITVVRDERGQLPLRLATTDRLGLIEFRATHISPVEEQDVVTLLDLMARSRHANTRSLLIDASFAPAVRGVAEFAADCDVLVLATRNATFDPVQAAVVRDLLDLGKPTVVLALRSPYDLVVLPNAPCYVASYGDQSCALVAAMGTLFGDFIPSGRLPFNVTC